MRKLVLLVVLLGLVGCTDSPTAPKEEKERCHQRSDRYPSGPIHPCALTKE